MKRFFITLAVLVTIYVIYVDLSRGTLNTNPEPSLEVQASPNTSLQYFQQEVQAGDTLLTIVDEHSQGGLSVSLETVVTDFKSLNEGLNPEEIQTGRTYFFPEYNE